MSPSQRLDARLNGEICDALNAPDERQTLLDAGMVTAPSTAEDFARYVQSETRKWANVVKDAGAKVE